MAAKSGANRIEKALQDIEVIQAFIADTNFYRRKYERRKTNFKTSIRIFTSDEKEFDDGSAACMNITPEGILLSKIKLKKNCIPMDSFIVKLAVESGELKDLKATAELVYLSTSKGKMQLGLAFTKLSKANRAKILKFLGITD
ncbi:MAG: hypothetical protein ACYS8W_19675 [Planctomycetota bacterium]|jgi:hypothetical protein